MFTLPNDVLSEIFIKLSPTDLENCYSACPTWNQLIQTTDFIAFHYRFHGWQPSGYLVNSTRLDDGESVINLYNEDSQNIEFPPLPEEQVQLCCVLNGIVCLSSSLPAPRITIWNPLLKEFVQFTVTVGGSVSMAWEGDDIMVIHIPQYPGDVQDPEDCFIRRRNSPIWEQVGVQDYLGISGNSSNAVINGKPYFNTYRDAIYGYVSFNPINRRFTTLSLPTNLNVLDIRSLLEIEGNLCLATVHHSIINIYVRNGNDWTRQLKYDAMSSITQILGSNFIGGIVMVVNGGLSVFNPVTRDLTELNDEDRDMFHYHKCCRFRLSLVRCKFFGMQV